MKRRSDPKDMTVFRTDRYFLSDGKWFFTTREGTNHGPFDTREEAEKVGRRSGLPFWVYEGAP
mgnify:CR=1 FL=1